MPRLRIGKNAYVAYVILRSPPRRATKNLVGSHSRLPKLLNLANPQKKAAQSARPNQDHQSLVPVQPLLIALESIRTPDEVLHQLRRGLRSALGQNRAPILCRDRRIHNVALVVEDAE